MKICLISFDFWHYDEHIVHKLKEKGIEATHINIGSFTHKNFGARVQNACSKVFLGKNLKYEKRQNFIIDSLKKIGKQDQILVINPESIEARVHEVIRQYTDKNIAYLYDSMTRNPAKHILHYFDTVYSFDDEDVKNFGFQKITNYNYLDYKPSATTKPALDLFYITSYDRSRICSLIKLFTQTQSLELKAKVIIAGKKGWKNKLKQVFKKEHCDKVSFQRNNISHKKMLEHYKDSKVILDLMRDHQIGLSFRVFEAMALEKKIITNNQNIKNYSFYNPNNILILNESFSNINKDFFNTPYQSLKEDVYNQYTLENWVNTVFNLNN